MRRVLAVMATVGAMLWFAPEAALAQAADGHLVGIVLDPTGASIPGCAVVVENVNTGVRWNQETDQLGAYRFNNLPVGQYTLSTKLEGFAATILSGIAITLNRSTDNLPAGDFEFPGLDSFELIEQDLDIQIGKSRLSGECRTPDRATARSEGATRSFDRRPPDITFELFQRQRGALQLPHARTLPDST